MPYDIGKLTNYCRFVEDFAFSGIKKSSPESWIFSKFRESSDGLYSAVEQCSGTLWDQKLDSKVFGNVYFEKSKMFGSHFS